MVDYPLPLSLLLDVATALRMGATPHAAGLSRVERSPVTKHRELPTISVSKSGSSSSKSETTHLTPKSDTHLSPHKSSPTHEVPAVKTMCSTSFFSQIRKNAFMHFVFLFILYMVHILMVIWYKYVKFQHSLTWNIIYSYTVKLF